MIDPIVQQQIEYYRARAGEYDQWFYRQGRYDRGPELNRRWFDEGQTVADALAMFKPAGSVLELACGTGIWTEHLIRHAATITAVDVSPEMLKLNRQRLQSPKVSYIRANLFGWEPDQQFEVVFFAFWLSHVPPELFESFWDMVRHALRPEGRFFFVDSLYEQSSTAVDHKLPLPDAATLTRCLNNGREFKIYKLFYDPADLQNRLKRLGWNVAAFRTDHYFLYAQGSLAA